MEQGHDQGDGHHGGLERVWRLSARALTDAGHPNLMADDSQRLAEQAPPDADVADVAAAVVHVVEMQHGTRPFRVHSDPADDGAAVVNAVADRIRAEFLTRIGLQDLLRPHATDAPEVSRR